STYFPYTTLFRSLFGFSMGEIECAKRSFCKFSRSAAILSAISLSVRLLISEFFIVLSIQRNPYVLQILYLQAAFVVPDAKLPELTQHLHLLLQIGWFLA